MTSRGPPHGPRSPARRPCPSSPLRVSRGRSRRASSRGRIRPQRLQSQPLSQSYRSLLPTSLTYFGLESRDCSPRGPDADIGTVPRAEEAPSLHFSRALHASRTRLNCPALEGATLERRMTRLPSSESPIMRRDDSPRPHARRHAGRYGSPLCFPQSRSAGILTCFPFAPNARC